MYRKLMGGSLLLTLLAGCSQEDTEQAGGSAPIAAPESAADLTQVQAKSRALAESQTLQARPAPLAAPSLADIQPVLPVAEERDRFDGHAPNPVRAVAEDPVSTFSIDVDTSAYAWVRRSLNDGRLPHKDAVRIEEMINYFDYAYPLPEAAKQPFRPTVAVYPTPWNPDTQLLHIGLKGYELVSKHRPRANLVFLLDTSGSMHSQDKLPLLKNALRLLVNNLHPEDTVAIVTYAGRAATLLEPTPASASAKIVAAMDQLSAGGSTAGTQGIQQAYALAAAHQIKEGVNRVILATDGDFNVGITDPKALQDYVARQRDSGIYLSVLGFGRGNYNDALMQTLAQHGNGNAAYIDTLNEARKVLVDEAGGTLFPIAQDVKIQLEFNPATVAEYRLIGYESRQLRREDFSNDQVDAGDIGSGHSVTALYEITPVGSPARRLEPLRYQTAPTQRPQQGEEYAFLRLRYKLPKAQQSHLLTQPVGPAQVVARLEDVPADLRFAASVAAFGQRLRGDPYLGDFGYEQIQALGQGARGEDPYGYRSEFLNLVRLAKSARPL